MGAPSSLDAARAAAVLLGEAAPVGSEDVALDACVGRIVAADLPASASLPHFDSSAMDGWAVRATDVTGAAADRPVVLRTAGETRAGHPSARVVEPGAAMRISTGARLPAGADAVVRIEETTPASGAAPDGAPAAVDPGSRVDVGGGHGAGSAAARDDVAVLVAVQPGRDVRRAGEDVAVGAIAVRAGERLHPGHVALLAGLGVGSVRVRARPRALVVVTGDEVVAGGGDLEPGRIHDVGGPALVALLRSAGARVTGVRHVGDDRDATVAALTHPEADLVVTCGGVSVGEHDHVRAALRELGADERVGGLALQPGRPSWLGALPGDRGLRPVLALPGNPGAAITVAALLAGPVLRAMTGRAPAPPLRARLLEPTRGDARRVRALRVALGEDDDGGRTARVLEGQQPHRLASLPETAAYALIPAADGPVAAGTVVEVVPVAGAGRV